MKRDIYQYLSDWKKRKTRKPLIIRGARQVGKTFMVDILGQSDFDSYVKINLEETNNYHDLFKNNDPKEIVNQLSIIVNKQIIPGETLLFFDEIQACPQAIASLRYFYEKLPELHVISAGSLLEHTLNEMNYSMPVGRVEFCNMYPFSFREFLNANDEDLLIEYMDDFNPDKKISSALHKKILEYIRKYFFVGGMPEAVKTFLESQNYMDVERVQSDIINSFQYDFSKYGDKSQIEHLRKVFRYVGRHVGRKVKYSNIDHDVRSRYLKDALLKLERSRIVSLVMHTNSEGVPLDSKVKENVFKPLFLDIGLLNRMSGLRLSGLNDLLTINEGMLAEQFIGQELLCLSPPYHDPDLYYWVRESTNSNAELDFLHQYNNRIFPIEIKAGKSGSLKSLQVYLAEKKLENAVRFNLDIPSFGNFKNRIKVGKKVIELDYKLLSLPLYMAGWLHESLRKVF